LGLLFLIGQKRVLKPVMKRKVSQGKMYIVLFPLEVEKSMGNNFHRKQGAEKEWHGSGRKNAVCVGGNERTV
jgi:hypothetical protein